MCQIVLIFSSAVSLKETYGVNLSLNNRTPSPNTSTKRKENSEEAFVIAFNFHNNA